MRESVIYQEILEEGMAEGIAKGMAEVVYTKLDDAKQAIENYDQHYFDG